MTLGLRATARHDVLFEEIFERELTYVCASARRLGVAPEDVEDVAHDVFVAVHGALARYDASRPLRPWLFGVVFRVVSAHRRSLRRRGALHDPPEPADPQPGADAQVETDEERRLVHAAVACIELSRRAVFALHELDEVSVPDIAEALGIPLNTAYSRLRLARAEFAEHVARLRRRGETP